MSEKDPIVVTLGDTSLRKSDFSTLQPGRCLTDAIISFVFEMISNSHHSSIHKTGNRRKGVILISPASVMLAKYVGEDFVREVFGKQLGVSECSLALLPVNDKSNVEQRIGGSHWSLLVFCDQEGFIHFDSAGGLNGMCAKETAQMISPALPLNAPKSFVECKATPRQENGIDCGVFVIAFAEAIVSLFETSSSFGINSSERAVCQLKSKGISSNVRQQLLQQINELISQRKRELK